MDHTIIVGLIFPLAFTIGGVILNAVSSDHRNGFKQEFKINIEKEGNERGEVTSEVIQGDRLRKEILEIHNKSETYPFTFLHRNTIKIKSLKERAPSLWETSVAIELCIGAVAANFVNLIQLINERDIVTEDLSDVMVNGIYLMVICVFVSFVFSIFLRTIKDWDNALVRCSLIHLINILSFALFAFSFIAVGRSI